LEAEKIRPVSPITTFGMSEVEKAFRMMQTGKHIGKIVLEPRQGDIVKILPSGPKPVRLSPDETYVIVGGVGGIGKSLAQMMVDRGARHLLLLSRNASKMSDSTTAFVNSMQATGASINLENCDVADRAQLKAVFDSYTSCLPPIRGVIQAAMVLKDCIFEQMAYADYISALHPKVQGTWNLHELLPDLRFFILLSSISGFGGNAGQANYAAGGSFQDAVARHRASQGLPAVSIDLGMVSSIGVVAGTQRVADHLSKLGLRPISEKEVWALVESAIRHPLRSPDTCQVVTGIPDNFVKSDSAAFWNRDTRFEALEKVNSNSTLAASNSGPGIKGQLATAKTLTEAGKVIEGALVKKLAEMFSGSDEIDPSLPLAQFGVDSLVAVELRNWLVAMLEAECSIFDVMHASSVRGLGIKIAEKSRLVKVDDE